eukprot:201428_1
MFICWVKWLTPLPPSSGVHALRCSCDSPSFELALYKRYHGANVADGLLFWLICIPLLSSLKTSITSWRVTAIDSALKQTASLKCRSSAAVTQCFLFITHHVWLV